MHVLLATDGSQQSIEAGRFLRELADPEAVTAISVLAVVSPLAAVPFMSDRDREDIEEMSFRRSAERATEQLAAELRDWGPEVDTRVHSGSPSAEIVRVAAELEAGLIVLASASTRTEAALMGSVAHRVMSNAACPVLVVRPPRRKRR